jgi:hypothetical protein
MININSVAYFQGINLYKNCHTDAAYSTQNILMQPYIMVVSCQPTAHKIFSCKHSSWSSAVSVQHTKYSHTIINHDNQLSTKVSPKGSSLVAMASNFSAISWEMWFFQSPILPATHKRNDQEKENNQKCTPFDEQAY